MEYDGSPAYVSVHELAMEVRSHVIVYVTLLLLHFAGLVAEDGVLVPSLGQRVGRVDQGIAFQ